jgi:uncharacterized iron-regulated protein
MLRAAALALWAAGPLSAAEIAAERLDSLPPADVVILGEVHDNPQHHVNQARAVAALQPRALVFEMLTPEQAARTPADRGDLAEMERAYGWAASGWPDFSMYHPIITASDAVVYGGDLPPGEARRAVTEDPATLFGPDAARYGLTEALAPQDQTAREADQRSAHCNALPESMLPGMVAAQRLRDAALARAIVQAFDDTGGPVAVITGSGHARSDLGIPAVLRLAAPSLRVLSIGQIEGDAPEAQPFDLWIVTEATPRSDPCAAFASDPAQDG